MSTFEGFLFGMGLALSIYILLTTAHLIPTSNLSTFRNYTFILYNQTESHGWFGHAFWQQSYYNATLHMYTTNQTNYPLQANAILIQNECVSKDNYSRTC